MYKKDNNYNRGNRDARREGKSNNARRDRKGDHKGDSKRTGQRHDAPQRKFRPQAPGERNLTPLPTMTMDVTDNRHITLRVPPHIAYNEEALKLTVEAYVNEMPPQLDFEPVSYQDVSRAPRVVVVGAGPGGLFAALRLIELGKRPVVLERGKDVHERRKDIDLISREHKVDAESNYSFGEGGAGAFSDGKLYTRSKKRGNVDKILRVFCQFGASTDILIDAHPHIGTDRLPRIIEAMRNQIIACGGEVHFNTRVDSLFIDGVAV